MMFRRQSAVVTLPNEECADCAIRLIRQGAEYSRTYVFWSCADVSVVACSRVQREQPFIVASLQNVWINSVSQRLAPDNGGTNATVYQALQDYIENNNVSSLTEPNQRAVCSPNEPGCFDGYCLNGGTCDSATGQCNCHRLFAGPRCQYKGKNLYFLVR